MRMRMRLTDDVKELQRRRLIFIFLSISSDLSFGRLDSIEIPLGEYLDELIAPALTQSIHYHLRLVLCSTRLFTVFAI